MGRMRVLVVDDDPMNLETFRRVFRRHLQVIGVTSPAEAMRELDGGAYDALLVDFVMPEMNGLELLAAAAGVAPATRRLLVTACSDDARIDDAEKSGVVAAVVLKPWRRHEIVEALERAVGRPITVDDA